MMRRRIGLGRTRGYTLLEALIALVLLAIVLPAIGYMLVGSRKGSLANYNAEQAASIAQLVVDSLGMIPLTHLSAITGTYTTQIARETFTVDWQIDTSRQVGIVTATVNWVQGAKDHSLSLKGVIR